MKKENFEKIRAKEQKEFDKKFKKIRKRLIKHAVRFRPWDYGFMLDLIEDCLEAMSLYLGNKYLVVQDTECELNQWKESTDKLKECYELFKNYFGSEEDTIEKAFQIMSKYYGHWWD